LVGDAETFDKAGCPTILISVMVVIIASRDTEAASAAMENVILGRLCRHGARLAGGWGRAQLSWGREPERNQGMVMGNSSVRRPYKGVFPVVPTVFDGDGRLDLEGQKRAVDFMIDAGSHGLCILANFSEQFVLTDAERDVVLDTVLNHVASRVPVIVTTVPPAVEPPVGLMPVTSTSRPLALRRVRAERRTFALYLPYSSISSSSSPSSAAMSATGRSRAAWAIAMSVGTLAVVVTNALR